MRKKTQQVLIIVLGVVLVGGVIATMTIPGLREALFGAAGVGPCESAFKEEQNADPGTSYGAPAGYIVCKVIVKAGSKQSGGGAWTYTGDGCQHGYCVSGIGSGSASASRTCDEGPTCHAISHVEFFIQKKEEPPTDTPEIPTDTPTSTNTPERETETPTPTNTPERETETPTPTPTGTIVIYETETPTPTDTPETETETPTPTPTGTIVIYETETPTPTPTSTPLGCPVCPVCPEPAPCPYCPPVPVFHTDEADNWDVARLPLEDEEDGIFNLTNRPGRDLGPTLSADGWWIAFQSDRDGDWEIYTMDFFGRHQTRQTYNPASDTDPVWTPLCADTTETCISGTIAFQSDRSGNWDIFLLDPGTIEGPFQVTTDSGDDTDPFWAPDGSALTFQSDRNGNWDIFTILLDGTDETQWTEDDADEIDPVWSPAGGSIAYASDRSGDWDLYLVDLGSGDEVQLTSGEGDGDWEIYAYDVISDVLVRLTDDPAADEAPSWDCDGTLVLFHSDRDGDDEIYSVALDDVEAVVQLTDQDSTERYAVWDPVSEDGSLALVTVEETPEPAVAEPTPTEVAAAEAAVPAGPNWLLLGGMGVLLALIGLVIGWAVGARRKE
jgi:dipeptidyl aminopeptidase/acylaminoacyl peptidase